MPKIQSAAIPYRIDDLRGLEILLVTSRRRGRWVLPKGNIKLGLLPHASAAHEAFEEAGVLGEIAGLPVGTYKQRKIERSGAEADVQICAYPLLVDTELRNWPEKAVRRRRWMRVPDALKSVQNVALRAVLTSFAQEMSCRDAADESHS